MNMSADNANTCDSQISRSAQLEPNAEHINRHLKAIAGDAREGFVEIAYNRPGATAVNKAKRFDVGDIDLAQEFVEAQNKAGSNMYVGVALRKSGGNTRASDDETLPVNFAVFDIDEETTVDDVKGLYASLRPAYMTVTGLIPHPRAHGWYLLDEPITDHNEIRRVNGLLVKHFDSDPSVVNPGRVMRIGGTIAWAMKPGRVDEVTRFEVLDPTPKPVAALEKAFGREPVPLKPEQSTPLSGGFFGDLKMKDDRRNYIARLTWAKRQGFAKENAGELPSYDHLYAAVFDTAQHKVDFDDPEELQQVVAEKVRYALRADRPPPPSPIDDDTVALTEDSIAEVFAKNYQGSRVADHHRGKWYCWDEDYWRLDETGQVLNECRLLCRSIAGIDDKRIATQKTVNAVHSLARNDQRLAGTSDLWDQHADILGVPSGVVNLRTGEVFPPDPALHITKRTAVAPLKSMETPVFDRFLEEVTCGDKKTERYLQAMAGYGLTGETKEHVLFFIHGMGLNGKTVFLNTVANIAGDYAVTASMDTFAAKKYSGHPTDIASLKGARIVSASETEQGKGLNESLVKQITGGDKIAARLMRQDMMEFKPVCKLIFIGNHPPQLASVDKAMQRRIRIIPFMHTPKTVDYELEAKLRDEWPGILQWMIDGAVEWYRNGLPAAAVVQTATEEYFESQDLFSRWLDEHCVIGPDERDKPTNLFNSYKVFSESHGEHPGNAKTLADNLKRHGFKNVKPGGVRYWLGLRASQFSPQQPPVAHAAGAAGNQNYSPPTNTEDAKENDG